MPGLPKSYIKKYGVSKRAWREFRKAKSRRKSTARATTTRRKVRRTNKMARKKRYVRRKKNMLSGDVGLALSGAGYGILRQPLNDLAAKIPYIGQFGDEVALLGLSFAGAYYLKGLGKKIAKAGIVIESHNLARNVNIGSVFNTGSQ